tara:strand:+ start:772 stop:1689 length:918 start_codon:yes stop_codon:yes gene_type:complete
MKKLAPIALFVYNRLDHLKSTIFALKKNYLAKSSELIIFSDGPKKDINNDDIEILKVRNYLTKIKGFKKITIIKRSHNLGLSNNIVTGISKVIKKYKKIIILEDDLVPSKFFLQYMNDGLEIYKKAKNVASIHAYTYPINDIKKRIRQDTFFLKGADCWGWATWARAWKTFDKNGFNLLKKIKKNKMINSFNFNDSYDYFQMLQDQVDKKNDSWAIRWYASCFLNDMYTLYPVTTLIKNIGISNIGTHSKFDLMNLGNKKFFKTNYKIKKQKIVECVIAREMFEKFFKKNFFFRFKNYIKKALRF